MDQTDYLKKFPSLKGRKITTLVEASSLVMWQSDVTMVFSGLGVESYLETEILMDDLKPEELRLYRELRSWMIGTIDPKNHSIYESTRTEGNREIFHQSSRTIMNGQVAQWLNPFESFLKVSSSNTNSA